MAQSDPNGLASILPELDSLVIDIKEMSTIIKEKEAQPVTIDLSGDEDVIDLT